MLDEDALRRLYRLIKAMRENAEIMVESGEASTKAIKEIVELCSEYNLITEALLFRGLLNDQKEINKLIRKILTSLKEYLEIKGLTP